MEYKPLSDFSNTYPNTDNYIKLAVANKMQLKGLYPEKNVYSWTIPTFNDETKDVFIKPVTGTSFRFILGIKDSLASDTTHYYTSEKFYEDMEIALIEPNPYFATKALEEKFFLTITLDKLIELFNNLKLIDISVGVFQIRNIFIGQTNNIDYEALVRYVDWVVGDVNPLDFDNNGVLPTEKVAEYEIGEYDKETGEFLSKAQLTILRRLEDLYDELASIDEILSEIVSELREPQLKKPTLLEYISVGASALVGLSGAVSGISTLAKAASLAKVSKTINTATQLQSLGYSVEITGNTAKQATALSKAAGALVKGAEKVNKAVGSVTNFVGNVAKTAIEAAKKPLIKLASKTLLTAGLKGAVGAAASSLSSVLSFATGPFGPALLGAVQVVKFFIGQGEEKKRYEAEKKEYVKTQAQLERLYQRKSEIEKEIVDIENGTIVFPVPTLQDTKITATQKYLQSFGKEILAKQAANGVSMAGG
jgi:methyl-accepting chemotaxis protein